MTRSPPHKSSQKFIPDSAINTTLLTGHLWAGILPKQYALDPLLEAIGQITIAPPSRGNPLIEYVMEFPVASCRLYEVADPLGPYPVFMIDLRRNKPVKTTGYFS